MKNVLALVDFSDMSDAVIAAASQQAKSMDAKCWLLHVVAPDQDFADRGAGPRYARDARATALREEHTKLLSIRDSILSEGIKCESLFIEGEVAETILGEVDKLSIDLVVLGSHGRSKLYELLIGSVTEFMLRNANVPIMIIPRTAN